MIFLFPFILVPSKSEISENEENPSRKHKQYNTHTEQNTPTSAGSKGRADFYYSHDQSVFTKDTCSDSIVNSDIKIDSDNSDSEDIVIGDSDKEEIIEDVSHDLGVDNNTNPYTCDICEKSFVKESTLFDHKETQHSHFSCRECHSFFKQKAKLKKHYENQHDRNCPHCYVYFSKYFELEQHVHEHAVADQNKLPVKNAA